MGTRSKSIETYLKKEKPWKHLIFVLNKCDLIPTWVTVRSINFCFALVCALPSDIFSYQQFFFFINICFYCEQKRWVAVLSQEYPTLAFHASLTNSFGKGSLIQLLRQFGKVSLPLNQGCSLYFGKLLLNIHQGLDIMHQSHFIQLLLYFQSKILY